MINLLLAIVVSAACGYFLSLPSLLVISYFVYRAFLEMSSGYFGEDGSLASFFGSLGFSLFAGFILMWLTAVVVRWEVLRPLFSDLFLR